MRILKDLLKLGTVDSPKGSDEKKTKTASRVTNKLLLAELVEHFNQQMVELSVGRRLLYPMSFNILLHPDDYNTTKESLPFVLPEVISHFYAAIKKEKEKYPNGVNYMPPAQYWFFQFSGCKFNGNDGHESLLERGRIITVGTLTTFDIKKNQDARAVSEPNLMCSVKCQNSNVNDNNINMDALLGMDILSEGTFRFNFDKNMREDATVIAASSTMQNNFLATLRWNEGNKNWTYPMVENYIEVSGKTESRDIPNKICKIDSDAVSISHILIRFDQATQTFQIAARAKTRVNSREIPLSTGDTPVWNALSKHSKIFLNDAISIEFKANID